MTAQAAASRTALRRALPLALMLSLPLAVNLAVWRGVLVPQQRHRQAIRQALAATEVQPVLESALVEGHQLLAAWKTTGFSASDPAAVMQEIQRLAGRHGLRIKELHGGLQQIGVGTTMPLELEVTGRFSKLAHWLSDVESCAGLQVDTWTLAPGSEPGGQHRLTIKLTADLRAA